MMTGLTDKDSEEELKVIMETRTPLLESRNKLLFD